MILGTSLQSETFHAFLEWISVVRHACACAWQKNAKIGALWNASRQWPRTCWQRPTTLRTCPASGLRTEIKRGAYLVTEAIFAVGLLS